MPSLCLSYDEDQMTTRNVNRIVRTRSVQDFVAVQSELVRTASGR